MEAEVAKRGKRKRLLLGLGAVVVLGCAITGTVLGVRAANYNALQDELAKEDAILRQKQAELNQESANAAQGAGEDDDEDGQLVSGDENSGTEQAVLNATKTFFDWNVLNGTEHAISLSSFGPGATPPNKAVLVVNIATEWGLAPSNFEQLNELYAAKRDSNLEIVAFPSNTFRQEPRNNAEIQDYVRDYFKASFPVMSKIEVGGENQHPLYRWLRAMCPFTAGDEASIQADRELMWNYAKFLIRADGSCHRRYVSGTSFRDINADIDMLLAA